MKKYDTNLLHLSSQEQMMGVIHIFAAKRRNFPYEHLVTLVRKNMNHTH